jgi:hypothetical protein
MIISIKSSASGGSSRGLVHYLAHSKLDPGKEGARRREFFNESENDINVRAANRHLSRDDSKPKSEELLHIVISPSKEEIESVADDQAARKAALRSIVRETVARLEKEVKARNLKWIAVAHFNTDNPHAHLGIQKQFINEEGKTETLRINRQMLHYNERSANGEKRLHKGALILAAENKIKEIAGERQKTREDEKSFEPKEVTARSQSETENSKQFSAKNSPENSNFKERRILAEEMLVAAEVRRRELNIENLVEHGDKKRFKIKDDRKEKARHVSLFDIERKIEITSRRKALFAQPNDAEKRAELAAKIAREMRVQQEPVIRQLETIRHHVLGFENRHLTQAQEKHTRLSSQKLLIEKRYERLKTPLPLPIFNSDEIQELQGEAIREQNLEKILMLESIRQSNAAELNRPSRRDRDVRELLAEKTVAELKTQAAEKRLGAFSANKDIIKVKVGDSAWSRRELERHELQTAEKNNFWTQVKLKTVELLSRSNVKGALLQKMDYPALHKALTDALKTLESARRDEIAKLKEFSQTLGVIFDAETNPEKTRLAPAFSACELSDVEDLSANAGRENFYETALLLQESWLLEKLAKTSLHKDDSKTPKASDEIINQKQSPSTVETSIEFQPEPDAQNTAEEIIGKYVLGRAAARSIIAEIKAIEAKENLDRYRREKFFVKHQIEEAKTGARREFSLRDVEPRRSYYLLDRVLEKALESKDQKNLRESVHQAAEKKEKELAQNLNAAQNRIERLENQKSRLLEKYSAVSTEIKPIFTPKEISALDASAARTIDKSEANRLEKVVSDAENEARVERIQDLLARGAKKIQILAPDLTQPHESKIVQKNDSRGERQTNNQSREISDRSVASDAPSLRINERSAETTHERITVKEKGRAR